MQKIDKQLEALLKEHEDRREENSWHNNRYHKQANFAYLYASIVIAISGILPSLETVFKNVPKELQGSLFVLLLAFGAMIGFYLFASTLDALYMMYLNGIRASILETEINTILGKDILIWNTQILNHFHSIKLIKVKDWLKPSVLVIFWTMFFFAATVAFLCFLCFAAAGQFFQGESAILVPVTYLVIVAPIALYHLYQWKALSTTGVHYIWSTVQQLSGVSGIKNLSTQEITELTKHRHQSHVPFLHWVPLLTIDLGVFPMALLSYSTNSFWPSSQYQFPFLLNTSVSFGDLLLIPCFNYFLYRLVSEHWKTLRTGRTWIFPGFVLILILSSAIQYWIHMEWINDQYTGFMDLTFGKLSAAGVWHLVFSSIQTSFVLAFLVLWYVASNEDRRATELGFEGWSVFTLYLMLGALDFVLQMNRSFASIGWSKMLPLQWPILLRIVLAFVILFSARRKIWRQQMQHAARRYVPARTKNRLPINRSHT
ncbi:MAG: hypothetical protein HY033_03710 [Ignavibacteriae bacterium]|nr:hypothetical protein [Ignavibacteria bacterium]MBI3363997.1 hypothetical protein [Ignavibacteriota bacterium]